MFNRILVAVDGSPTSNRGLGVALAMARDQKANVVLLHVIDELAAMPPIDTGYVPVSYMDNVLEGMRERGRKVLDQAEKHASDVGITAKAILAESHGLTVSHVILAHARKGRADLIVLGTHGRRGFRRLVLGSDAENVLREATCPVLLVRAPERAAPGRKSRAQAARRPKARPQPRAQPLMPA